MRRLYGMILAMVVVLALAAPAMAEGPAGDASGWTWSSVAERLGGWADSLWRAFASSQTEGEEEAEGSDPVTAEPGDTSLSTTAPDPTPTTEGRPEFDPDG